ncbi:MAG: response regulator, partial [Mycobacterium sp.]|nr:response regulator [Mycobacterium sp.]
MTAMGHAEASNAAVGSSVDGILDKPVTQSGLVDLLTTLAGGRPAAPQDVEALPRLDGVRLLLVEDIEINQQIAVELLHLAGASVDIANNGKEAVDKAMRGGPERYDAILMDLQMPVMDGFAAT